MEKLKTIVSTEKAPAAIGPYSQAVCVGEMVFLSGQLAIDPASGNLVEGGIEAQTEQALKNIEAILAEAGLTMDNVIKTTVFLADINDFTAMNEVYAKHFNGDYPARSAVQAAALPKGGLVEIECICSR
jgi:2-iminobutanoate/2-iminopropanoate deaminase